MREYTCREVKIPYSDMTVLRQAGKLKVWADFGTVSILYKSPDLVCFGCCRILIVNKFRFA
jgi:hypothetical protein